MLKSREEINELLSSLIRKKDFGNYTDIIVDIAHNKHKIPKGELTDYLSGRKDWSEASDIIAYITIEAFNEAEYNSRVLAYDKLFKEYFTKTEIGKYSKFVFQSNKIKFPLHIPCYQVTTDQWIGASDIKLLIQLGEAQLIRYNENAQRIMRKKITGDREEFIPYVNRRAVNEITQFYKENIYIPNTLTLNIPDDVETSFRYDNEAHEIIFSSIECLDITDGYHRYLAALKAYNEDKEFNTPIELRITRFSDEKARGFIYQEDQKTKMTRIESKSMQVNAPANIIVERLNTSSSSNLKGIIQRVGGIINQPMLVSVIDKFYLKGNQKVKNRAEIIEHYKIIEDFFNMITDTDTSLLEKEWSYNFIVSAVMTLSYMQEHKDNKKKKLSYKNIDLNKVIVTLADEINTSPSQRISSSVAQTLNSKIENLITSTQRG